VSDPEVSVVITCFNYERFVGEAVESALAQTGVTTEVIVVDDGSRDGSRRVIEGFGDRVVPVMKENEGQASALNAGFRASRGNSIIFLDADDVLLPSAASATTPVLVDRTAAKAHWPMPIIDGRGERTGAIQDPELAEGDLRQHVFRDGPLSDMTMPSPPMSGNAFPRWFLEAVMPIPLELYRTFADEYLFGLAPAFGKIVRLAPQSLYRVHGANDHMRWTFERMLSFQQAHHAILSQVVADVCGRHGIPHDETRWRESAWCLRTAQVVAAIEQNVPPGASLALVDQGSLGIGSELRGRRVVPFPEAEGEFAGAPVDDDEALSELHRLSPQVDYLAIAWPAFWWLEEYPRWASRVRDTHRLLQDDRNVLILSGREDDQP
jgi:hypothetical protein